MSTCTYINKENRKCSIMKTFTKLKNPDKGQNPDLLIGKNGKCLLAEYHNEKNCAGYSFKAPCG